MDLGDEDVQKIYSKMTVGIFGRGRNKKDEKDKVYLQMINIVYKFIKEGIKKKSKNGMEDETAKTEITILIKADEQNMLEAYHWSVKIENEKEKEDCRVKFLNKRM